MQVLTREMGKSIMIGDSIVVTLQGISGSKARVFFGIPNEMQLFKDAVPVPASQDPAGYVLLLERDETIHVGSPEFQVCIVDVRGNHCRFGIVAPNNVGVYREELYQAIKKEEQDNA